MDCLEWTQRPRLVLPASWCVTTGSPLSTGGPCAPVVHTCRGARTREQNQQRRNDTWERGERSSQHLVWGRAQHRPQWRFISWMILRKFDFAIWKKCVTSVFIHREEWFWKPSELSHTHPLRYYNVKWDFFPLGPLLLRFIFTKGKQKKILQLGLSNFEK